jgi:hypothetical protein
MPTLLRISGILLIVIALLIVTFLGWAALKGFFTAKGLHVDLPAQGRVVPLSVGTLVVIILSIVILGVVMLMLGKRPPQKNITMPNQHQGNP